MTGDDHSFSRHDRQRRSLGTALGCPPGRLGAQRGPPAPHLRGGARTDRARARLARARHRLRRRRLSRPFLPPRPPDAPPDPDLSRPGALQTLAKQAGLSPESEFDATWVLEYPDAETIGRALIAVAGLAILAGPEREQELRTAIVDG